MKIEGTQPICVLMEFRLETPLPSFAALNYADQLQRLTHAAQSVLGQYNLASANVQPVVYVSNAVFKVTTGAGNSYTLRLHHPGHHHPEWIRSELIWLASIHQNTGLHVPQPVPTVDNDWLSSVSVDSLDEPLIAVLFRWIDGQFFQNDIIPLDAVQQAGTFLARLHQYAAIFTPPPDFVRPRLDWEGLFGENSAYNPGEGSTIFTTDQKSVFADVERRVRTVMEEIGQHPHTFGLIHADFIAKNWLFNQHGICAIDFDDCSWGYYLYDLAPGLLQFKYEPHYTALRAAFLTGYTTIRPLVPRDELHLEAFIAARHLASCRWLAGNMHNPRIRERAADLIAQRTGELRHFLKMGSIDEGGRKEFF